MIPPLPDELQLQYHLGGKIWQLTFLTLEPNVVNAWLALTTVQIQEAAGDCIYSLFDISRVAISTYADAIAAQFLGRLPNVCSVGVVLLPKSVFATLSHAKLDQLTAQASRVRLEFFFTQEDALLWLQKYVETQER